MFVASVRLPTIFGLNMMLLGNLIYLMIDVLPTGHRYGIAMSRILIGIGSSLQALFTPLGEDGVQLLGWSLNMYKAPALLAAVVNIVGIIVMHFAFDERYAGIRDDDEAKKLPSADLIAVTICIVTRFTQLSVSTNIET
ncbi:unnamed protein product [Nippostrongylus brasiliensis]|uniref:MFS domain-containing protein n=1 Tax=Nippostrongylus brasiliensis TaxID=27835 RepID=A0A0N4YMA9_NIPBR|nr:unnamed protein product [Nippostrongylus brasiliensis]